MAELSRKYLARSADGLIAERLRSSLSAMTICSLAKHWALEPWCYRPSDAVKVDYQALSIVIVMEVQARSRCYGGLAMGFRI